MHRFVISIEFRVLDADRDGTLRINDLKKRFFTTVARRHGAGRYASHHRASV
jgi:hypothetical protein